MSERISQEANVRIPVAAGVAGAEPLGAASAKFLIPLLLTADRGGPSSPNAGNVYFRSVGTSYWNELTPGATWEYPPKTGGFGFGTLDQIEVYADIQGDGVRVTYNHTKRDASA